MNKYAQFSKAKSPAKWKYTKCLSKQLFLSKEEVLRKIQSIGDKEGIVLRYYKCSLCGGFHLTKRGAKTKNETR